MEKKDLTPQQRYRKKAIQRLSFDLNTVTDKDILEFLETQPSKAGFIKKIIREYIASHKTIDK